jgi:hypothetical protein
MRRAGGGPPCRAGLPCLVRLRHGQPLHLELRPVCLSNELKGPDLRQTFRAVATITAGKVTCKVSGTEVGEFEGPGMLTVEHLTNMNYNINVWCPEEAGKRPTRRQSPLIQVMKQRATDYATLVGKDPHEHPDTDAANGLSGTETIEWALKRQ